MKLDPKKFFFILAGINVLLVASIVVVFLLASSTAQKSSNQIANLKADDQTNDQLINYYKALQGTLNANSNLESTLQLVLPTSKEQSTIVETLNQFSQNTNVNIQQVSFSAGTNKQAGATLTSPSNVKGVSFIALTLSCKSVRYENLLAFLQEIENAQRRMQVASLDITPNATDPDLLDQVSIGLDVYLKGS